MDKGVEVVMMVVVVLIVMDHGDRGGIESDEGVEVLRMVMVIRCARARLWTTRWRS